MTPVIGPRRNGGLGSATVGKRLPIVPAWECQETGDCCRTASGIRLHPHELKAMLTYIYRHGVIPTRPVSWRLVDGGFIEIQAHPCPFLDGNRCSVYEARPYQCRRFQCHRAPGEAFDPSGPLGCKNLSDRLEQSRETRRAYAQNQRKAMKWALKHGWTGREA